MTFTEILESLKRSCTQVFWESNHFAKEHADTLLKCATEIYIAQEGKYILIKEEK